MKLSKAFAYQANRHARKSDRHRLPRSIGLECLENRTVFASDLDPMLNEVAACFAIPAEEVRTLAPRQRTVEVANSPLAMLQGDVIRIEVPEAILLQLTSRDSYALQVYYAENYFAYDSLLPIPFGLDQGTMAVGANALGPSGWSSASSPLNPSDASNASNGSDTMESLSHGLFGQYSSLLLASLTASKNFQGTVRIVDFVQEPTGAAPNAAIAALPNEIRIEPLVTFPTALRDPGATLVKTIIVNRTSTGLSISDQNAHENGVENNPAEGTTPFESATSDAPCAATPSATNDSTNDALIEGASNVAKDVTSHALADEPLEQKSGRPRVALKTIDISMARRGESSRAWMRSSTIANPAVTRASESKELESDGTRVSTALSLSGETESFQAMGRERRVPGTQLQPVEFLLAASTLRDGRTNDGQANGGQTNDRERVRMLAADRAFIDFSEEEWKESDQNRDSAGLFEGGLLQTAPSASKWRLSEGDGPWDQNGTQPLGQEPVTIPTLGSIQDGVATNKESWKNALRTASESTAGQLMLASLTTLAVQNRDMNAFGTRTAWEFVTKRSSNNSA